MLIFYRQILYHHFNVKQTQLILMKFMKLLNIRYYHEGMAPSRIMGIDYLNNPSLNKGLAFTLEERQALGIHGLQAPLIKTQDEQIELCKLLVNRFKKPLNKYIYLSDLLENNEHLYFRLLIENLEELMPIVYTPTVGEVCQKYGIIFRRPKGLFITANDRGHILSIVKNWPEPAVQAIVVTDGERILGLGDLGAYGMAIPAGKLALYTALGGMPPNKCLPIQLDCGTNNTKLLEDPLYIGLRQPRLCGKEYYDFLDEFMEAIVKRFGPNTLIQFEDFGNRHAFKLLDKYKKRYCTFNDDIQGTGAVALSGLYVTKRLTGKNIIDHTILFVGAGEAAIGIANMCIKSMHAECISMKEAYKKIVMFDIDGLLCTSRLEELQSEQVKFCQDSEPITNLYDVVQKFNPSVIIGASAAPGIITEEILKYMAEKHERPIVFALSNPDSKVECTAEQAYQYTNGRVIYASGSPFPPVEYNGKTYQISQCNNAYIFPGVAFGIVATQSPLVPEEVFLVAAQTLADSVSDEDLKNGTIFPPLAKIPEISLKISADVAEYTFCNNYATVFPEPKNIIDFLKSKLYNCNYKSALPDKWDWPEHSDVKKPKPLPIRLNPMHVKKS